MRYAAHAVPAAAPANATTVQEFPLTTIDEEPEVVKNVLTADPEAVEELLDAADQPVAVEAPEPVVETREPVIAEPENIVPAETNPETVIDSETGEILAPADEDAWDAAPAPEPEPTTEPAQPEPTQPEPTAPAPVVVSDDSPDTEAELAVVDPSGAAATGVVEPSESFQSIAVTWPTGEAAPRLQVRVRDESGEWGPWRPLEDDGARPDAGQQDMSQVRAGTDTVFVGDADAFQIATVGTYENAVTTADAKIAAIGTPVAALGGQGEIVNAAYHPEQPGSVAFAANVTAPRVYTRAEWGAAARKCAWSSASTLKAAVVHHTAGSNSYGTQAAAMQQIRNDQAYHQNSRGWCDLGYNFVVDKWGNIYEGATGSLTSAVAGAHTGGFNTGTVGISMLGDYTSVTPDPAVVNAVGRLAAWRLAAYGVAPTGTTTLSAGSGNTKGWAVGSAHTVSVIAAHQDLGNTDCPGTRGYAQMAAIRAAAQAAVQVAPTITVNVPATQNSTVGKAIAAFAAPAATISTGAAASYSAVNLPDGIAFDAASRTFSGTPSRVGAYTVTLTVSAGGVTQSKTFAWNVAAAAGTASPTPAAPTITVNVPAAQSATVSKAITALVLPAAKVSTGAAASYAVSGLPAGLAFNANNRTITGKPTAAGTYTVTVKVTAGGATASKSFTWKVSKPTITVQVPAARTSRARVAITAFTVPAAKITPAVTATYKATNLPAGITFNPTNRKFSGKPTKAGTYKVTITVSAGGASASKAFTWKIS